MWWNYGDGWSWLWMAGMMVLFWGAIIILAAWAIRSFAGPRSSGDAAMETLRRRLAAGEISEEEFEKTRKALLS